MSYLKLYFFHGRNFWGYGERVPPFWSGVYPYSSIRQTTYTVTVNGFSKAYGTAELYTMDRRRGVARDLGGSTQTVWKVPVAPLTPVKPVAPVGPGTPVCPICPVDPTRPAGPWRPVAPVAPDKPLIPVNRTTNPPDRFNICVSLIIKIYTLPGPDESSTSLPVVPLIHFKSSTFFSNNRNLQLKDTYLYLVLT